jgi:hypothetical protein
MRPQTGVNAAESGVGIASEFPADGRAGKIKLPGDGCLVDTFTTPLFDVEPLFMSQMFSLHATGSPVGLER